MNKRSSGLDVAMVHSGFNGDKNTLKARFRESIIGAKKW